MDQQFIVTIGPALGGKSTFCNHVPNFATFSFATPLYQMLAVVAGPETVKNARADNRKSDPLDALQGKSLRQGLQTLGTEWGRNLMGENIWVDNLLARTAHAPRVCIDDLRFPNEYERLKDLGAVFVRMMPYEALRKDGWMGHVSESFWRTFKVHHEVQWNTREDILEAALAFDVNAHVGTEPKS
jgi:hypothetical protein